MKSLFLISLLASICLGFTTPNDVCSPADRVSPFCREVILPIHASANNTVFPPFNSTADGAFYTYVGSLNSSSLGQTLVSGTYNISATYCEPSVKVQGRENTVQFLVHGVAYTKSYWSGLNYPFPDFQGQYSWVSYATSQGYATLAIDRLGNGASSRPDPINVVQAPLQVEILHQITKQLRDGALPTIPIPFKNVVMVTHSFGSTLGSVLATNHPTSGPDAYILTGTSNNLTGIQGTFRIFGGRAASVTNPVQFGHLEPGYVTFAPNALRDAVFARDGEFDPSVLHWDESQPHIFAVGEVALLPPLVQSNFTGPVMVLTGRQDQIVCGAGNITESVGDCGVGKTSNPDGERVLFPKASRFDSYIPDKTGHNGNTHYSAGESFGAAHAWLQSVGF